MSCVLGFRWRLEILAASSNCVDRKSENKKETNNETYYWFCWSTLSKLCIHWFGHRDVSCFLLLSLPWSEASQWTVISLLSLARVLFLVNLRKSRWLCLFFKKICEISRENTNWRKFAFSLNIEVFKNSQQNYQMYDTIYIFVRFNWRSNSIVFVRFKKDKGLLKTLSQRVFVFSYLTKEIGFDFEILQRYRTYVP